MIEANNRYVVPLLVFLADWSIRWGLVLAALALWFSLRPPRLACTRHTLCLVALAAGILLPVVPRWGRVPIAWLAPIRSIEPAASADLRVFQAAPRSEPDRSDPPSLPQRPLVIPSGTVSGPARAPRPAVTTPTLGDRIKAIGGWCLGAWPIAGSWTVILTLLMARMIGGRFLLAKLRKEAVAVDAASQRLLADCRAALGLNRRLHLAMHPGVASPVTLVGFRPLVLVPPQWEHWPRAHRRASLLHDWLIWLDATMWPSCSANYSVYRFSSTPSSSGCCAGSITSASCSAMRPW